VALADLLFEDRELRVIELRPVLLRVEVLDELLLLRVLAEGEGDRVARDPLGERDELALALGGEEALEALYVGPVPREEEDVGRLVDRVELRVHHGVLVDLDDRVVVRGRVLEDQAREQGLIGGGEVLEQGTPPLETIRRRGMRGRGAGLGSPGKTRILL